MSPVVSAKQYVCPGETHPISRAVHLSRLAAFYPACRECPFRTDARQLPVVPLSERPAAEKRVERKSLFTAEGVRGVYLNELTRTKAAAIAAALAVMLWEEARPPERGDALDRPVRPARPSVVVGYDERSSSPDLVTGVTASLRRMGCQVIDIALTTKPCLWFAVDHLQASAGVYVTAGGCDPSWTGLDFVGRGVRPFSRGGELDRLEARLRAPVSRPTRHSGPHRSFQAFIPYEAGMWKHFHALRPLKVCFGSSSRLINRTLERIFANLPCRLIAAPLPERRRNMVSARDADAVRLAEGVRESRSDLGVMIDDDGQCCAFFDERGRLVPALRISQLVAGLLLEEHSGGVVVGESAACESLRSPVERAGGELVDGGETLESASRAMADRKGVFGGGTSGRMWFGESYPACDAVLSIARVLGALSRSDAPFSEVVQALPAEAPESA